MIRASAAIVAGLLIGAAVIALGESAGHALFPPPAGLDPRDSASMRAIVRDLPLGALIAVLLAWAAGVFAGAAAARWIARAGAWPAYVVGAILFAMAAWTMALIAHPWWMWAGAVVVMAAAAFAATRLPHKRSD